MALIVEDGTGLSTAEAYASVATADDYHAAMGNTTWTGTDAAKEVALRRATQYIDSAYSFRGIVSYSTQRLQWPRVGYESRQRVETWPPRRLVEACCEAALRALTATLQTDVQGDAVTREKVGEIEIEYAQRTGQTRMPVVDALLRPYTAGGLSLRLERAT